MLFSPALKPAKLIKRYKRFLADAMTPAGKIITVHCPNTGSMTNCWSEGDTIWYSSHDNPKRKLPYTWELSETQSGHFIGINTHNANKLVAEALQQDIIKELLPISGFKTEVNIAEHDSRLDFAINHVDGSLTYMEVKSVTLLEADGIGYFPDAISSRGQKHLRALIQLARQNQQSALCFCVQHSGIKQVRPAQHIDSQYVKLLTEAKQTGVKILAYQCDIDSAGIKLNKPLPVEL